MQDLNDKVTGGTLTADEWNEVPSEIQNVIEGLGIALSGADLNQLGKAIAGYVANGNFYTDSGAADAYVLTKIGLKQTLPAYTDGMSVEYLPGNTNTGASTVNVAGLGNKNIVNTGVAGTITAGVRLSLRYRSGTGDFEIVALVTPDASTTVKGIIELATQTEVDAGTDTVRAVVPDTLANSVQASKAWVNFNGVGTVAKRDDFNVTSITDHGVGDYSANLTNAMADANYCIGFSCSDSGSASAVIRLSTGTMTTTTFRFRTTNNAAAVVDTAEVFANVHGAT